MKQKSVVWLLIIFLLLLVSCDEEEYADDSEDDGNTAVVDQDNDNSHDGKWAEAFATEIEELLNEAGMPGASIAVIEGQNTILSRGFGTQELNGSVPVTEDSLFHIASTNKSLTAMLVASLVDDGILDWDTPIVTYLPEFSLSDPAMTEQVTIRHLLSMQSGIPDTAEDLMSDDMTASDIFMIVQESELLGEPGDEFSYSNISSSLAGYIAVLATGGSIDRLNEGYARLLKERVLDPIGMSHSIVFASEAARRPEMMTAYYAEDGSFVAAEGEDIDADPLAPSGILKSSAADMALYISTQIGRGKAPDGTQVVTEENMIEMWKPELEDYGMGWEIREVGGLLLVSHTGSYAQFGSIIGFSPEANVGFVILMNSSDLADDIWDNAGQLFVTAYEEN